MTDRDPAFLWETAAMRSATHRVAEDEADHADPPDLASRWVTLKEASRATGIPVETLRKWARRSTVPSHLAPTNHGTNIRMVDLEGVQQRASELGRSMPEPSPSPQVGSAETPSAPSDSTAPPGTMIVPVDAWNKMLNQLGNLHEAGQQLASARERAAKAETEAKFLKERLAELRTGEPPTDMPIEPEPSVTPPPPEPPEKVWQFLMRRVRDR